MSTRPTVNTNYRVLIAGPDDVVSAWLPETFDLRLQSDWEPLIMNAIDSAAGTAKDISSGLIGAYPFIQAMTGQIWRGTGPVEFNLQLLFDAETSAYKDVTAKIKKLVKWATPKQENGMLHAPGPTITGWGQSAKASGSMFTLSIGNMLIIPNVIFPSLDVTWHTAPTEQGDFIAADVNLAVRTFYVPTQDDILSWFKTNEYETTDNWLWH